MTFEHLQSHKLSLRQTPIDSTSMEPRLVVLFARLSHSFLPIIFAPCFLFPSVLIHSLCQHALSVLAAQYLKRSSVPLPVHPTSSIL